jgi:hypothetical protein
MYLGQDGQDELWSALDARSAVVFVHPADLPESEHQVHPEPCRRLRPGCLAPNGGRDHADTGASPADTLDDFASFYFDTALSSSAAALPTLLAYALALFPRLGTAPAPPPAEPAEIDEMAKSTRTFAPMCPFGRPCKVRRRTRVGA